MGIVRAVLMYMCYVRECDIKCNVRVKMNGLSFPFVFIYFISLLLLYGQIMSKVMFHVFI